MFNISEIEKAINYTFNDKEILLTALTHTSYSNENGGESYQRLEFLGDSVLGFITAEKLYLIHTKKDEGFLSKMRASIVCEESLAEFAKTINLDKFIRLGIGEIKTKGMKKASILSDAFEALLGAIYLDSDLLTASEWLSKIITNDCYLTFAYNDYKTILQEKFKNKDIHYFTAEVNDGGEIQFHSKVLISGVLKGEGIGSSKKNAEQNAAKNTLKR